ncbi:PqqD family protein [Bacteroides cellulolyticus]|uniref:PqqD family protein n=1 Tax=Bacteroides cellulolyticus TaxID=2981780 RepID=UPI0012AB7975|nr:PqqD family protein [Bacteroides cellulolyticus]MCU6772364.1 PqqD family protein [Bacteroides cellulolyticus]
MMRQKEDLVLRKVGKQYLIVDTRDGRTDMSDVYCMNESAAMIWKKIGERECSIQEIAEWLCGEYDVDIDVALKDVEKQIDEWRKFGLIE